MNHIPVNLWNDITYDLIKTDAVFSKSGGRISVNAISIFSNIEAKNSDSGTLYVAGGLNVGGNLVLQSTALANMVTGPGSTGPYGTVQGAVYLRGGVNMAGNLIVSNTAAAVAPSSACALFAGGILTFKNLYVQDATPASGSAGGAIYAAGGLNVAKNVMIGATDASTSPTSGALVLAGGMGINGDVNVAGSINCAANTTTFTDGWALGAVTDGTQVVAAKKMGGMVTLYSQNTTAPTAMANTLLYIPFATVLPTGWRPSSSTGFSFFVPIFYDTADIQVMLDVSTNGSFSLRCWPSGNFVSGKVVQFSGWCVTFPVV